MQAVLDKTGLKQFFDETVSADDVTHHKPDPEPYERALNIFGLIPTEAIVIEDSPTGYASAVAAKIPVLIHRHAANKHDKFPEAVQEFKYFQEIEHFLN
jgi:HAD superfamily hydrolase (TIGR01509 family)